MIANLQVQKINEQLVPLRAAVVWLHWSVIQTVLRLIFDLLIDMLDKYLWILIDLGWINLELIFFYDLVRISQTLPLPVQIQQMTIWNIFLNFSQKYVWRQFAWNVKAYFLGKLWEIFQIAVCWKFYPALWVLIS